MFHTIDDMSYYEDDPQQLFLISFHIFLLHFCLFFKKKFWGQFLDVSYVFLLYPVITSVQL